MRNHGCPERVLTTTSHTSHLPSSFTIFFFDCIFYHFPHILASTNLSGPSSSTLISSFFFHAHLLVSVLSPSYLPVLFFSSFLFYYFIDSGFASVRYSRCGIFSSVLLSGMDCNLMERKTKSNRGCRGKLQPKDVVEGHWPLDGFNIATGNLQPTHTPHTMRFCGPPFCFADDIDSLPAFA